MLRSQSFSFFVACVLTSIHKIFMQGKKKTNERISLTSISIRNMKQHKALFTVCFNSSQTTKKIFLIRKGALKK